MVVVARDEIHRQLQPADPFERLRDQAVGGTVTVKHIASNDDETRRTFAGDLTEPIDGVEPEPPQMGLTVGIVNPCKRLAQLPVGRMEEGGHSVTQADRQVLWRGGWGW